MSRQKNPRSGKDRPSASNKQLKAAHDQLQASEQQLRAANQQLDASNQQLRASEQEIREKETEAQGARIYAESIIETVREPLVVLDGDLRVVTAGQSFYDIFKVTPQETEGKLIYEIGNRQWDIPELRGLLEDILPMNNTFNDYEVKHDFETIGRRDMLLNARLLVQEAGKAQMILLAIEDITERKQAEDALKAANQQLDASNQQLQARAINN